MRYQVEFSDGLKKTFDVASPQEAFKKGQKEFGIGRYVSRITGRSRRSDIYYAGGNYLDPSKEHLRVAAELSLESFVPCIKLNRLGIKTEVMIDNKYYYMLTSKAGNASYSCELLDYKTQAVLRKLKCALIIEDDIPLLHKFKDRTCIHCDQGLFDIDDPNGECGGK